MLHKAWNSKGEMPCCFPRSSIKFQGHTGQNITDFDPNWAFPDYRPVAAFKFLGFALLVYMITSWLFNILPQNNYLMNTEKIIQNSLNVFSYDVFGQSHSFTIILIWKVWVNYAISTFAYFSAVFVCSVESVQVMPGKIHVYTTNQEISTHSVVCALLSPPTKLKGDIVLVSIYKSVHLYVCLSVWMLVSGHNLKKSLVQFTLNLACVLIGECSAIIQFSAPNVWPHGGLKLGQIWGVRILTEKVFIQFTLSLAVCFLVECSEIFIFSVLWPNIWRPAVLEMDEIWGFWTLTEKVFIQFITNLVLGDRSQIIQVAAPWPNVWPPVWLKLGQIWGVRALTGNFFIQFISNLAGVLTGWVFIIFPFSTLWPKF